MRGSSWNRTRALYPSTAGAIFVRGNERCAWCRSGDRRRLEIDHVVPREKGGLDGGDNLVPACSTCNQIRARGRRAFAARLRALGIDLADAWREVRRQLAEPLDRARGRVLAEQWYPWVREREERRNAARRSALGGVSFPFGALADKEAA